MRRGMFVCRNCGAREESTHRCQSLCDGCWAIAVEMQLDDYCDAFAVCRPARSQSERVAAWSVLGPAGKVE